jgi:hypothetical protein
LEGENGNLKKLSCSNRAMCPPSTDIICKGIVVRKYIEGGQGYVDMEIWAQNPEGKKSALGTAQVVLQFRG